MKFVLIALLAVSANVSAGTQKLLTITNDMNSESTYFSIVTDDRGDVVSFVNQSFLSGKLQSTSKFTADQAIDGVVLSHKKGRDVVRLVAKNFNPGNGGHAVLDYLANGVSGARASLELELNRDSDTWAAYYKGKKVTKLKILSRKVAFIGIVGIRQILAE